MRLFQIIELLRVRQWYKNLLVFLPAVFAREFNEYFLLLLLAFVALCLLSSGNYVVNDVFDKDRDKKNAEKRNRLIASGKISDVNAVIIACVLFASAILLSLYLNVYFTVSLLVLFVISFLYSAFLKNEIFVDVILIGVNFVVRTLAGFFVIKTAFSPWLILCPFFLAVFLAVGKRDAEIRLLGNKAYLHRINLRMYSREILDSMMIISTTLLVAAYTFFSIFSSYKNLVFTLPIVVYA